MPRRAHPIDVLGGWLSAMLPGKRSFSEGWGDDAHLALLGVTSVAEPAPIEVVWGAEERRGELGVRAGSFPSPVAELPAASRTARFVRIRPMAGSKRLVVLMAAWNEHGYDRRTELAELLAERGVGSVLLENPYYGSRRSTVDPVIRTVADFALMGRGAVEESRSLLAYFGASHSVGVSGYSMGGNTAALAGAAMPFPVAIAALGAAHSPGPVWTEGVIRRSVDWAALGGAGARGRLAEVLGTASVLGIPAASHTAHAVVVGARSDGYIPRSATTELHNHWPGSELRWLPGGHATVLWRQTSAMADAVVDAFDRLEGGRRSSGGG